MHITPIVRKFDRIREQIHEHLLNPVRVNFVKIAATNIILESQVDLFMGCLHLHDVNNLLNDMVKVLSSVVGLERFVS
jgi:hypothetical protein